MALAYHAREHGFSSSSRYEPRKGTGPRVDSVRAATRLRTLPHRLLAFPQGDGFPWVVPVIVGDAGADGIRLGAADWLLPPGGRRAGLLGHEYRAQLIGLTSRQHTGWLTVSHDGETVYAPHTETGFAAPANKTLLLIGNGFMAKRGSRQAGRAGAAPPA